MHDVSGGYHSVTCSKRSTDVMQLVASERWLNLDDIKTPPVVLLCALVTQILIFTASYPPWDRYSQPSDLVSTLLFQPLQMSS